jgi:plastocyanin
MSKRTSSVGLILIGVATLWPATAMAGGGGGCSRSTQGSGDTVEIAEACFTPNILRTDPGTTVAFLNKDPFVHNVVATGWGHFEDLGKGEGFSATFDEPGIYPFACTYHLGMTGAVVVGDGTGPGAGKVVTVDSAFAGDIPAAAKPAVAAAPASTSETGAPLGWVGFGAAAGLVAAGGLAALARRRS